MNAIEVTVGGVIGAFLGQLPLFLVWSWRWRGFEKRLNEQERELAQLRGEARKAA